LNGSHPALVKGDLRYVRRERRRFGRAHLASSVRSRRDVVAARVPGFSFARGQFNLTGADQPKLVW
jgi:hypothetical protein